MVPKGETDSADHHHEEKGDVASSQCHKPLLAFRKRPLAWNRNLNRIMLEDGIKLHLIYVSVSVTIGNLAYHHRIALLVNIYGILHIYAIRLGYGIFPNHILRMVFGNLDVLLGLATAQK